MRKKFTAFWVTLVLCILVAVPVFAASKPALELMYFTFNMNPAGGVSPSLHYRNNSTKTIKYIDWNITAYNRVGDRTPDEITGYATKTIRTVGPIEPFQLIRTSSDSLRANYGASEDSPFTMYKETAYCIDNNGDLESVYQDENDNFFIRPSYDDSENIYLTEDEIQNAMFYNKCDFDAIWYNNLIDYLNVDKVVITYMDGTTQILTNMGSKYRNTPLQNKPFIQQIERYSSVYNYRDYAALNPDLESVFGTNQKRYFEHFISNGMKEGRQGSKEFDLAAYKANNPDLAALFGNDNVKYYEHYIAGGKQEGRLATAQN